MTTASAKIVQALLGKAFAETILVSALAISFFFQSFPPYFRGWGELSNRQIIGWANNAAHPGSRVEVQLFIDGAFISNQTASQFRPDVRAAGWATDDWHGYRFDLPQLSTGAHQARIYALHSTGQEKRKTLQLLGDPIEFVVEADGGMREVKQAR
jgi:hypothetical protein